MLLGFGDLLFVGKTALHAVLFLIRFDDVTHGFTLDDFTFKKLFCHIFDGTLVGLECLFDIVVALVEGGLDVAVHLLCHLLTVVGTDRTPAQEAVLGA